MLDAHNKAANNQNEEGETMTTTTATLYDQLDQISAVIDAFCIDGYHFDDHGNLSEQGGDWLVDFLGAAFAEIGDDALAIYIEPRSQVFASMGNPSNCTPAELERAWHDAGFHTPWGAFDFRLKLKKGTPPHLSKDEVLGMLITHRDLTFAFEEARVRGAAGEARSNGVAAAAQER
jgi:hypothetical protein